MKKAIQTSTNNIFLKIILHKKSYKNQLATEACNKTNSQVNKYISISIK